MTLVQGLGIAGTVKLFLQGTGQEKLVPRSLGPNASVKSDPYCWG